MNRKELLKEVYGKYFDLQNERLFFNRMPYNSYYAVEFADGTIGYVMLRPLRDYYDDYDLIFSLYLNGEDFSRYASAFMAEDQRDPFGLYETLVDQSVLEMCPDFRENSIKGFYHEFLNFARDNDINIPLEGQLVNIVEYEREFEPSKISNGNLLKLSEALEASKLYDFSKEDGIPPLPPEARFLGDKIPLLKRINGGYGWEMIEPPQPSTPVYLNPEFTDAGAASLISGLPFSDKSSQRIQLIRLPFVSRKKGSKSRYPLALYRDRPNKARAGHKLLVGGLYNMEEMQDLLNRLAHEILSEGKRPAGFVCSDDRTIAFLKDFSEKTGIPITDSRLSEEDSLNLDLFEIYQSILEGEASLKEGPGGFVLLAPRAKYSELPELNPWRATGHFSSIMNFQRLGTPRFDDGPDNIGLLTLSRGDGEPKLIALRTSMPLYELGMVFMDLFGIPDPEELGEGYYSFDNKPTNVRRYVVKGPRGGQNPPSLRPDPEDIFLYELLNRKGLEFRFYFRERRKDWDFIQMKLEALFDWSDRPEGLGIDWSTMMDQQYCLLDAEIKKMDIGN